MQTGWARFFNGIGEIFNKHDWSETRCFFDRKKKDTFFLQSVSSHLVCCELRSLKANKAIGLDRISTRLLKDYSAHPSETD